MKNINLAKRVFILVFLLILLLMLPITHSRYETEGAGNIKAEVAYYVVDASFQYIDVRIPDFVPRKAPYVYGFKIQNFKENKRTEVKLEYDLVIKTTTNLNLEYKLYMNEDYNQVGAKDIIISNEIVQDEEGTYFREMKVPKEYFTHEYDEVNNYTLLIYFDEKYKAYEYQDMFESIFITIDSKQIV